MRESELRRQIAAARTDLDRLEAKWVAAIRSAQLIDDAPGLGAQVFDREGTSGSGVADPTAAAAARGVSTVAADRQHEFADTLRQLRHLATWAVTTAPLARTGDGRIGCGNTYGCPEHKPARRNGRCVPCAMFLADVGRERRPEDVADAAAKSREGARLRQAAKRERDRSPQPDPSRS